MAASCQPNGPEDILGGRNLVQPCQLGAQAAPDLHTDDASSAKSTGKRPQQLDHPTLPADLASSQCQSSGMKGECWLQGRSHNNMHMLQHAHFKQLVLWGKPSQKQRQDAGSCVHFWRTLRWDFCPPRCCWNPAAAVLLHRTETL